MQPFTGMGAPVRPASCLAACAAFLLLSCTTTPPLPQQLVSVGAVMNSLMCGLVKAHQAYPKALNNQSASVALELKIVNSAAIGVSVGAGGGTGGAGPGGANTGSASTGSSTGSKSSASAASAHSASPASTTSVIAWQGLSLTPSLSASYTEGWTVDTTTTLVFMFPSDPSKDTNICTGKEDAEDLDQFGFSRWLADTLSGVASISDVTAGGTPMRKFLYDANFGVQAGINGSLTIVPVALPIPITPSGSYSRNDVQHLTVNIPKSSTGGAGMNLESMIIKNLSVATAANAPVISLDALRRLPE
jgi:hypothetical protein